MRLLLDQCIPLGVVKLLDGHAAVPAASAGWAELTNGRLLEAAEEAGFDVLLTSDRNLRYQQNLAARRIGILVLSTNNWPVLQAHGASIVAAVEAMVPGGYHEVPFPRPILRRRVPPGRVGEAD